MLLRSLAWARTKSNHLSIVVTATDHSYKVFTQPFKYLLSAYYVQSMMPCAGIAMPQALAEPGLLRHERISPEVNIKQQMTLLNI